MSVRIFEIPTRYHSAIPLTDPLMSSVCRIIHLHDTTGPGAYPEIWIRGA